MTTVKNNDQLMMVIIMLAESVRCFSESFQQQLNEMYWLTIKTNVKNGKCSPR